MIWTVAPHFREHHYRQKQDNGAYLFDALNIDERDAGTIFNEAILLINYHFGRVNNDINNNFPVQQFQAGLYQNK